MAGPRLKWSFYKFNSEWEFDSIILSVDKSSRGSEGVMPCLSPNKCAKFFGMEV